MILKKYIKIIAAFWIIIICTFTLQQEYLLFKGKEVLLKTIPVDPRDLFRGDYVVLNYEIAQIPKNYRNHHFEFNKTVYVTLDIDKNNIGHIKSITKYKPSTNFFLEGKIKRCDIPQAIIFKSTRQCIHYGIETYFVKEGTGKKLENDLRDGTLVKIIIDKNGKAKVKGFENI